MDRARMFLKSRATRVVFVCFILAGFVEGWFYLKYENEYGELGVSKSILAEGRYQRSPYAVLEHIPNTVNLKAHYRQNNYGFRNEEDLIVPKPSDEFRVFLFGASAALGQGAMGEFVKISGQDEYETKYTLAARLEELLANVIPGKRVKVFDAAVSGYKIHQCYLSYLSRVRDLQSDLVISLDGHNEQFNSEYEKYTPFADMRDAWEYHPQRTNPVTRIGMYLMGKSYTFFYVGKKIFTTGFFRINPDDPFDQSFYDQWKKRTPHIDNNRLDSLFHARNVNIDAACKELLYQYDVFDAVLTLDNVPHAFLSQPLLALKAHRTEMEEVLYNYLYSPDFWIEERTLWYLRSYPYFLSLLAAHAKEKGILWMNLQEYVDGTQEQVFIDYCHFSKEGNAYLAKGIADFITTRGLLKIQP